MAADGALGSFRARIKDAQFRVVPLKARPHISYILGAVAADLWLRGYHLSFIDKHLSKQFKKATRLSPPRKVRV
jgi:hypothetical protein